MAAWRTRTRPPPPLPNCAPPAPPPGSQTYDKMGTIAKVPSWKGYNWNTECLHGLGAICHTVNGTTRCPSVFPAPPGMGATFNLTIAHELGRVISDEIRAFSNSNGHRGYQNRPIGVRLCVSGLVFLITLGLRFALGGRRTSKTSSSARTRRWNTITPNTHCVAAQSVRRSYYPRRRS